MNQEATLAQMRELKLVGMAQAFEALCLLPIDKQPASDQLLAQILEAEDLHRRHRRTMAAIKHAQFRYQASLEEIILSPERNLSKDIFHRLTDLSFAKKAENILITGATGCGKSFIATALGYQACQMGLRVGYFSLPKLLQRLHLAKADGSYVKELARIEKLQVIILDDWGDRRSDYNPLMLIQEGLLCNLLRIGMANILPSLQLRCQLPNGMNTLPIQPLLMHSWTGFYITLIE